MAVSRNNHYVPQMYLNNWGTDNKIFVHRFLVPNKAYPDWERCAIRTTAYIENLYVRIENDEEYDDFEIDFNSQFETPAKPILNMVGSDQKMTSESWRILSDYITAQYVRTPSFYHLVSEWGKKIIPKTVDSILEDFVKEPTELIESSQHVDGVELFPLKINIAKKPNDTANSYLEVKTVIGKNIWLSIINHTLSSDSPVKRIIRSMKWSIVSAPTGIVWPTCDNPVIIAKFDQRNNLYITDGLGNDDSVIIFPVSPSKLLLGAHKRKFEWRFDADRYLAQQIINVIVRNALMYVYSSSVDFEISKIRERMVDEEKFRKFKTQYDNWYDMYKKDEAPLLKRRNK